MSDNYQDLLKVYKAILDATQEVQKYLRYHSGKYFRTMMTIQEEINIPHV
jgi:hypothetical protein